MFSCISSKASSRGRASRPITNMRSTSASWNVKSIPLWMPFVVATRSRSLPISNTARIFAFKTDLTIATLGGYSVSSL